MRPLFYLQSKPYKERNPLCMPAILTLAHRDVIIVFFSVCLSLIRVIYISSLVCVCVCAHVHLCPPTSISWCVFKVCVRQDSRCQAITQEYKRETCISKKYETSPLCNTLPGIPRLPWRAGTTTPSPPPLSPLTSRGVTQGKTSPHRPLTPPRNAAH